MKRPHKRLLCSFFILFLFSGSLFAGEIKVAVASNFKYTLQKLAADFKTKTGHDVQISSASSGKLFTQIQHGAPFDVFLSADVKHVDLLVAAKKADADNSFIYALGKLVLLSNITDHNVDLGDCQNILSSKRLKRLAIANPEIAPYGLAAKRVMQKLNLWDELQPRIVMGSNIAQTLQYVTTKNAQAGFVAYSMINKLKSEMAEVAEDTCLWQVPMEMYAPIKQKMVLLNTARDKLAAQVFVIYMQSPAAKEIIKSSGYDVL